MTNGSTKPLVNAVALAALALMSWRVRVGQATRVTSCFFSWRPQRAIAVSRSRLDPRDPAMLGFSQEGIDQAIDYAKRQGSTSGMIIQHGLVVGEWGDVSRRSNLFRGERVS